MEKHRCVRMRAAWFVVPALVLAGCSGGPADTPGGDGPDDNASGGAPTTIDQVLNATSHMRIAGTATIRIEFENATPEAPEVVAILVYMGNTLKKSVVEKDDDVVLAAFIPVKEADAMERCGQPHPRTKAYAREVHGTGNGDTGNLTGQYTRGWYHLVVIGDGPQQIDITIGDDDAVRPRRMPEPDPWFAGFSRVYNEGPRSIEVNLESGDGSWYAWAAHRILGQGSVDGGRTNSIDIGGCAVATEIGDNAFLGGGGGGGGGNNQAQRVVEAEAAGPGTGPVRFAGDYRPQQDATAPDTTRLEAGIVRFDRVTVPPPSTMDPAVSAS